jgi:hypothetical protein
LGQSRVGYRSLEGRTLSLGGGGGGVLIGHSRVGECYLGLDGGLSMVGAQCSGLGCTAR